MDGFGCLIAMGGHRDAGIMRTAVA